jgi:hypothetical protein
MAKKLIYTGKPIVDPECKKRADEFQSAMNTDADIVYMLNHCKSISLVNDKINGKGVILDYGTVQFLVYLDETKHILGTSTNSNTLLTEFKDNALLLKYINQVLTTATITKE